MSNHYYSKQPQSEYVTSQIVDTLRNKQFTFFTATGVFSKKQIDFGTRLLIETFQVPDIDGPLLDLGCGYGPIGIALAYEYAERSIKMVDINERAVHLAGRNIEANRIPNAEVWQSDGFSEVTNQHFAAIVTNPPIRIGKKALYPLLEQSANFLVEDGELWVVIRKKQGAPSLITHLETIFKTVLIVERKKGYFILKATL